MSYLPEDLEHVASESSQQDWSDARFAEVYRKGFIEGGNYADYYAKLEIEQLQAQLSEHERLHGELAAVLRHDAEAPSLCDLVAVARSVVGERDALAALVEQLTELGSLMLSETDDETAAVYLHQFDKALQQSPTACLAGRDAQIKSDAIREVASMVRQDYGHHTQYSVSLLCAGLDGYADSFERDAERVK